MPAPTLCCGWTPAPAQLLVSLPGMPPYPVTVDVIDIIWVHMLTLSTERRRYYVRRPSAPDSAAGSWQWPPPPGICHQSSLWSPSLSVGERALVTRSKYNMSSFNHQWKMCVDAFLLWSLQVQIFSIYYYYYPHDDTHVEGLGLNFTSKEYAYFCTIWDLFPGIAYIDIQQVNFS